jgi:hypothetical protein
MPSPVLPVLVALCQALVVVAFGPNPNLWTSATLDCVALMAVGDSGYSRNTDPVSCTADVQYRAGAALLPVDRFTVQHDGCAHYFDLNCPAGLRANAITATAVTDTLMRYEFRFISPPLEGGASFTVQFVYKGAKPRGITRVGGGTGQFARSFDFVVAQTTVTTYGGAAGIRPSLFGCVVAVVVVLVLACWL